MIFDVFTPDQITQKAKTLFKNERAKNRLDGWFIAKEKECEIYDSLAGLNEEVKKASILNTVIDTIPLDIDDNALFAGTQDDAFARSYALINPSFKVEEFCGYCDPSAVFGDIEPNEEFTEQRIQSVKAKFAKGEYAKVQTRSYAIRQIAIVGGEFMRSRARWRRLRSNAARTVDFTRRKRRQLHVLRDQSRNRRG